MTMDLETHTNVIHLTTDNDYRTPSYKIYENNTARYPLRTTFFIKSLVPPPRIHSLQRLLTLPMLFCNCFLTLHSPKTNRLPNHSTTLSNASLGTSAVLGHDGREKRMDHNGFQSIPNWQRPRNYSQYNTLNLGSMSMRVRQNLVF